MKFWKDYTDNEVFTIFCTIGSIVAVFWVFGYPEFLFNQIKNDASFSEILDNFIFMCALWVGVSFIPLIAIYSADPDKSV